jgi:YD repeat-containing protein
MDMRYLYANGQNNGCVTESIDGISGEDVQYTYDSLQRLVLAQTTNTGPQWGDAYTYDGFGNLTAKTVTKGSAPALAVVCDLATNRPVNGTYHANGNAPMGTWGVENRLVSQTLDGQAIAWGYDGSGQRVMKYQIVNGQPKWTFYLYDLQGRKIAQVGCSTTIVYTWQGYVYSTTCASEGANAYYGNRLVLRGQVWTWQSAWPGAWVLTDPGQGVVTDRLGSVRAVGSGGTWSLASYFGWGEEKQPLRRTARRNSRRTCGIRR